MKRFRVMAAALCAVVLLCGFSVPAYAYADGGEGADYGDPTMTEEAPAPEPTIEPGEGFSEEGNLVTRDLLYDEHTNKQFITVQTSGGNTFYIVIDYDKPVDEEGEQYETYFFSVVDEADLLAAAEAAGVEQAVCSCSEKCEAGAVNTDCAVCSVNMSKCVGVEPEPEPTETQEPVPEEAEPETGGNTGMLLLILAVAGIGGVAAFYFKVLRPKQQQAAEPEEDYGEEDYEDEGDASRIYRMATLLGPVFAFLFDNAPVFRGKPSLGMARSRIWHHVDVDRCGIVPGALEGLSFEDYILWVSSVKPILFTDEQHVTTSTGDSYTRDIMSERPLTRSELMHLLSMVFPNVRLKGFVELREMDSLPPRLAAACTSFTGALFYDKCLEAKLADGLSAWMPGGFAGIDENDAVVARLHLEEQGWNASVYGVPVGEMVRVLVAIARENIACGTACAGMPGGATGDVAVPVVRTTPEARAFDLEGIEMLAKMWRWQRLPRDTTAEELAPMLA